LDSGTLFGTEVLPDHPSGEGEAGSQLFPLSPTLGDHDAGESLLISQSVGANSPGDNLSLVPLYLVLVENLHPVSSLEASVVARSAPKANDSFAASVYHFERLQVIGQGN